MTIDELIAELNEAKKSVSGGTQVFVASESFDLVDMDSDFNLVTFSAVPVLGIQEISTEGAISSVVLARKEPAEIAEEMVSSGWFQHPADAEDLVQGD